MLARVRRRTNKKETEGSDAATNTPGGKSDTASTVATVVSPDASSFSSPVHQNRSLSYRLKTAGCKPIVTNSINNSGGTTNNQIPTVTTPANSIPTSSTTTLAEPSKPNVAITPKQKRMTSAKQEQAKVTDTVSSDSQQELLSERKTDVAQKSSPNDSAIGEVNKEDTKIKTRKEEQINDASITSPDPREVGSIQAAKDIKTNTDSDCPKAKSSGDKNDRVLKIKGTDVTSSNDNLEDDLVVDNDTILGKIVTVDTAAIEPTMITPTTPSVPKKHEKNREEARKINVVKTATATTSNTKNNDGCKTSVVEATPPTISAVTNEGKELEGGKKEENFVIPIEVSIPITAVIAPSEDNENTKLSAPTPASEDDDEFVLPTVVTISKPMAAIASPTITADTFTSIADSESFPKISMSTQQQLKQMQQNRRQRQRRGGPVDVDDNDDDDDNADGIADTPTSDNSAVVLDEPAGEGPVSSNESHKNHASNGTTSDTVTAMPVLELGSIGHDMKTTVDVIISENLIPTAALNDRGTVAVTPSVGKSKKIYDLTIPNNKKTMNPVTENYGKNVKTDIGKNDNDDDSSISESVKNVANVHDSLHSKKKRQNVTAAIKTSTTNKSNDNNISIPRWITVNDATKEQVSWLSTIGFQVVWSGICCDEVLLAEAICPLQTSAVSQTSKGTASRSVHSESGNNSKAFISNATLEKVRKRLLVDNSVDEKDFSTGWNYKTYYIKKSTSRAVHCVKFHIYDTIPYPSKTIVMIAGVQNSKRVALNGQTATILEYLPTRNMYLVQMIPAALSTSKSSSGSMRIIEARHVFPLEATSTTASANAAAASTGTHDQNNTATNGKDFASTVSSNASCASVAFLNNSTNAKKYVRVWTFAALFVLPDISLAVDENITTTCADVNNPGSKEYHIKNAQTIVCSYLDKIISIVHQSNFIQSCKFIAPTDKQLGDGLKINNINISSPSENETTGLAVPSLQQELAYQEQFAPSLYSQMYHYNTNKDKDTTSLSYFENRFSGGGHKNVDDEKSDLTSSCWYAVLSEAANQNAENDDDNNTFMAAFATTTSSADKYFECTRHYTEQNNNHILLAEQQQHEIALTLNFTPQAGYPMSHTASTFSTKTDYDTDFVVESSVRTTRGVSMTTSETTQSLLPPRSISSVGGGLSSSGTEAYCYDSASVPNDDATDDDDYQEQQRRSNQITDLMMKGLRNHQKSSDSNQQQKQRRVGKNNSSKVNFSDPVIADKQHRLQQQQQQQKIVKTRNPNDASNSTVDETTNSSVSPLQ